MPPLEPKSYTLDPVSASEAQAWQEDLRALVHQLEQVHPNPYHKTPEAEFRREVAALDARIPQLASHEVVVELAELLALVGDGHTSLPLYMARGVDFRVLPYRLGVYEDGIYVEAADEAYADLVGGRVVRIGNTSAHEALGRVTPLISRDNDNWILTTAPFYLNRIEVLHALGMSDDLRSVELVVEVDGEPRRAHITPLVELPIERMGLSFLPEYTETWIDARDTAEAPPPLFQQRFDDLYWWTYLPEMDVLYIKWDQVQNREAGPTALETFREAMAFARERRPAKTLVDIRNNTGGEGTLTRPIIREIIRTQEVDEPGKLFVAIGRRTFSAGQMTTAWFEQFTSAILVGEPSSAYYNGYAGHDLGTPLPNSGIMLMISNAYYQMGGSPHDTRQQATPRLAAIPTFADYRANRDPVLDVILTYEPDAFIHGVRAALVSEDAVGARALVRTYAALPVNRFAAVQSQLNTLGYGLIQEREIGLALAVFELNVEVHPEYANGWDSLGEAYVWANRRTDAIAAFRQALTIQPDLAASQEWLRHLGAEKESNRP